MSITSQGLAISGNELFFNGVKIAILDTTCEGQYKLDDAANYLDYIECCSVVFQDGDMPDTKKEYEEEIEIAKEEGFRNGVDETTNYLTDILRHTNKTFFGNSQWMYELSETIRKKLPFADEIPQANGDLLSALVVDVVESIIKDELDHLDRDAVNKGAQDEIDERNEGMRRQSALDAKIEKLENEGEALQARNDELTTAIDTQKKLTEEAKPKPKAKPKAKAKKPKHEKVTFSVMMINGTTKENKEGNFFIYELGGRELKLAIRRVSPRSKYFYVSHLATGLTLGTGFEMPKGTRSIYKKVSHAKEYVDSYFEGRTIKDILSRIDSRSIINPEFV